MAGISFKKYGFNIFTALVVVASLSFAFRLVNVFTFQNTPAADIGIVKQAAAVEKADVEKAIRDTAAEVNADAPAEPVVKGNLDAAADEPPPMDNEQRDFTTSEIEVLQDLSRRRAELDAREKMIGEREALLKAAEQAVDKKIAELGKMQNEIKTLLGQQETMAEDRITSLVKIYEAMKPKEAATIFNTLDMDVMLSVVGRMNERKLSPILASMDPEKARLVTIKLAEQRQLPAKSAAPDAGGTPPSSP